MTTDATILEQRAMTAAFAQESGAVAPADDELARLRAEVQRVTGCYDRMVAHYQCQMDYLLWNQKERDWAERAQKAEAENARLKADMLAAAERVAVQSEALSAWAAKVAGASLPVCRAEGRCLQIVLHPEATDSPAWWGIDMGTIFRVEVEEAAQLLAERVNQAIALAAGRKSDVPRCRVTGNPCGTDTMPAGVSCLCSACISAGKTGGAERTVADDLREAEAVARLEGER